MMKRHSVVIVEDHTILREGLKALLNASDDLQVIGEAGNGIEAIRCIKDKTPNLALLDLSMPRMGGISVIKEISKTVPETKVLVLTMYNEEESALEAFRSGAKGYCLKNSNHQELMFAIRSVLAGKSYVSPEISAKILENHVDGRQLKSTSSWDHLTQREKEVLKLVGEGYRSKSIADLLCISIKTVEKHRANIMHKLDLHTASALTAYAIDKGLVVK